MSLGINHHHNWEYVMSPSQFTKTRELGHEGWSQYIFWEVDT